MPGPCRRNPGLSGHAADFALPALMRSSPQQGRDSASGWTRSSKDRGLLSQHLNNAHFQRQDEMSQPGRPGSVMELAVAVLALEFGDPCALLDQAGPQQAREPTPVQAMTRSRFVVWRGAAGILHRRLAVEGPPQGLPGRQLRPVSSTSPAPAWPGSAHGTGKTPSWRSTPASGPISMTGSRPARAGSLPNCWVLDRRASLAIVRGLVPADVTVGLTQRGDCGAVVHGDPVGVGVDGDFGGLGGVGQADLDTRPVSSYGGRSEAYRRQC
jgi:hypothetical protein